MSSSCEHRNAVETLGVLTCVDCGAKRTSPERDEYVTNTTRLITRRLQARGYSPDVLLDVCVQLVMYMSICEYNRASSQRLELDDLDDRAAMRALQPHLKRVQKMLAARIARIPT